MGSRLTLLEYIDSKPKWEEEAHLKEIERERSEFLKRFYRSLDRYRIRSLKAVLSDIVQLVRIREECEDEDVQRLVRECIALEQDEITQTWREYGKG